MKYQVGDKFVNLVKNDMAQSEVGDIFHIVRIDNNDDNLPYLIGYENNPDLEWWYSTTSIEKFTIPLAQVSDRDMFTAKMTGKIPGQITYHFTKDDFEFLDPYFYEDQVPDWFDDWKKEYYFGQF